MYRDLGWRWWWTYGDNSMEYHAVVVSTLCQLCKVLAGLDEWETMGLFWDGTALRIDEWTYSRGMVPIKL